MKAKIIEMSQKEIEDLIERLEKEAIEKSDYEKIKNILKSYIGFKDEMLKKNASISRLKKMIFGSKTESSRNLLKEKERQKRKLLKPKIKPKGHGRMSFSQYKNAEQINVSHDELTSGSACPSCKDGKVYPMQDPKIIVRITGSVPFESKVYKLEQYRCNLCQVIFTAKMPDETGNEKYDIKAKALLPILRYGYGFPHYRLEALQKSLGHPFPDSNQWEVILSLSEMIEPIYYKLLFEAAQGEVIHNDDTNMKILSLIKIKKELYEKQKRTGIFTTGILSIKNGKEIALFFTGKNHAGENMKELLKLRAKGLGPPIQMCDALSRNVIEPGLIILAYCLLHGRRKFTDLILHWKKKIPYIIEQFALIYKNEAYVKRKKMSAIMRLNYHRQKSSPVMKKLKEWFQKQFDEKEVEPNSDLGVAINYMLKNWKEFTLFLRKENAPIDNNICERALKKAIIHRKNSMFFKTENGARIGDMFMSIIHTCCLHEIDPFDYFIEIQKNIDSVKKCPGDWLPWNYKKSLLNLAA